MPALSPAMPSSSCFLNISTPVHTVLRVSRKPTISTSSPTFTLPRSMLPVTTVPRPEIEKMSSIGIRNGWSTSRFGCGTYLSTASISSSILASHCGSPFSAPRADPRITGTSSPGNWYFVSSSRTSISTRSISSRVFHRVALVQEHHDVGHAHLARQQHVLLGLRHRPVGRRHHQNRPVHLRRAGDHVLDVVGVARAVHVRVVTVGRLVLHVRRGDRDAALPLFRRVVDRVERAEHDLRVVLLQYLGDRRRQRRLAVIDVPDRPHVHVRLRTIKFFLRHKSPESLSSLYSRYLGAPASGSSPKTSAP